MEEDEDEEEEDEEEEDEEECPHFPLLCIIIIPSPRIPIMG